MQLDAKGVWLHLLLIPSGDRRFFGFIAHLRRTSDREDCDLARRGRCFYGRARNPERL
jgi:hypothetical protein